MLSFMHSIVTPVWTLLRAQHALLALYVNRIRTLWSGSSSQAPVLFDLPLPYPDGLGMRLQVPAAALECPSTLSLSRAQVEFVWHLDRVIRPRNASSGRASQLDGRVAPPLSRLRRARQSNVQVELVLRRQDPTEGFLRVQQLAGRAVPAILGKAQAQ